MYRDIQANKQTMVDGKSQDLTKSKNLNLNHNHYIILRARSLSLFIR